MRQMHSEGGVTEHAAARTELNNLPVNSEKPASLIRMYRITVTDEMSAVGIYTNSDSLILLPVFSYNFPADERHNHWRSYGRSSKRQDQDHARRRCESGEPRCIANGYQITTTNSSEEFESDAVCVSAEHNQLPTTYVGLKRCGDIVQGDS